MITKWTSGLPETICGKGSTMKETSIIRDWLPQLVKEYQLKTIADVGCGDRNWITQVNWGENNVFYQGFDLEHHGERFDCTRDILPLPFDLVLCIYVLNHLYESGAVQITLKNLRASGSRYLLATYNDVEGFPWCPIQKRFHKTKRSKQVTRKWFYGIFEL
jgi:hypothetical protein